jgi:two-component system, NarL family, response regulator LiaR
MRNNQISVCIIDSNKNTATFLSGNLNKSPGAVCTGVFSSGEEALKQIPQISPDIVLLDVNLPGITGIDCVKQLKKLCKGTQFMIYTACDGETTVIAAFKAGATSYILNSCSVKSLAAHISELYNGGSPMSSSIARKLIQWLQQPEVNNQEKYAITKREKEILLLLDKGGSYNTIAASLFISSKTVRKHIYNIYGKLHVSSKIEAVNRFFGRS